VPRRMHDELYTVYAAYKISYTEYTVHTRSAVRSTRCTGACILRRRNGSCTTRATSLVVPLSWPILWPGQVVAQHFGQYFGLGAGRVTRVPVLGQSCIGLHTTRGHHSRRMPLGRCVASLYTARLAYSFPRHTAQAGQMAEKWPARDVVPQDEATVHVATHDIALSAELEACRADRDAFRTELEACKADRDALRTELEPRTTAHNAQQAQWARTEHRLLARNRQLQRNRLGDSRW
jgi:hypothetical protein